MSGKTAGLLFLGVCLLLALFLLTGKIEPLVSGCIFASTLVVLGRLSSGFRRRR
jgi:hypothetical protein